MRAARACVCMRVCGGIWAIYSYPIDAGARPVLVRSGRSGVSGVIIGPCLLLVKATVEERSVPTYLTFKIRDSDATWPLGPGHVSYWH